MGRQRSVLPYRAVRQSRLGMALLYAGSRRLPHRGRPIYSNGARPFQKRRQLNCQAAPSQGDPTVLPSADAPEPFVVILLAILANEPREFQKVRSCANEHVVGTGWPVRRL